MEIRYWTDESPFYRDKDTRDGFLWEPESSLPLIRFHSLEGLDWLEAACSTRKGGVSTGCLAELNLGRNRGDVPENVLLNYQRITSRMGFRRENLVLTGQIHGTRILYAESGHTAGSSLENIQRETDGLITGQPGLLLAASFADCVPVLLVDPAAELVGIVHSGWKGTVGKISRIGVEKMAAQGAVPERMQAVIGPCISRKHYEVTGEVIRALSEQFSPEIMGQIAQQTDDTHWLCDLPAACWAALREAGLGEDRIHFSGICTWENGDLLFSHRKTGGRRGNFNVFAGIRSRSAAIL